ncbi:hypothetical protein AQUCO_00400727v1 [Aquilegia coerulea]|uniref:Uncharacterized protein n=1 Tax=Aquilegia coerulea TaxID=218851 RepID=A0A2G5EWE2_AQUCA|nr:hypothetical protein AQUCO_00400727v1 [Aquilegia coerulea]
MQRKNKEMGRGNKNSLSLSKLVDSEGNELDVKQLLKDIEFLGSSRMTWKERKELENRKVVSLGGKPPKKYRTPLSVARVSMKKQKDKEQKMDKMLGHSGGRSASSSNKVVERRKAEDRVLKSSEGHFSKGVLDVKHLLRQDKYGGNERSARPIGDSMFTGGQKKKGSKQKGKKKGKKGGKKRR